MLNNTRYSKCHNLLSAKLQVYVYNACESPACLHTVPYFPEEMDSTVPQQQTQTVDCFRCRAIFPPSPFFSRASANKPRWSSLSVICMGPSKQLWVPMTQVWLRVTEGCREDYKGGYKVALGEIKDEAQKTWGEVERSGARWCFKRNCVVWSSLGG